MVKLVWPNYDRSLLNITATILRHYGVATPYASLTELIPLLKAQPQHVVVMIFDGMGASSLKYALSPQAWLRRHQASTLTSVFPSTTTAAMTSYYTGKSPLEHGWLGWSMYLKPYGRAVDLFTNRDSVNKSLLTEVRPADALLSYEPLYNQIERATEGRIKTYSIGPKGITLQPGVNRNTEVDSIEEMALELIHLCALEESNFIMTYWPEPDAVMHEVGPKDPKVRAQIQAIDQMIASLAPLLKESILIVSADHGQIEVKSERDIRRIPVLYEALVMPPTMEPRAASLHVKSAQRVAFGHAFRTYLGPEFRLLTKQQVLKRNLFGRGTPHPSFDDALGDYLACGTGSSLLICSSDYPVERFPFRGHHAGLCADEMLIPLVMAKGGQNDES